MSNENAVADGRVAIEQGGDLTASLAALSRLSVGIELTKLLTDVAAFAVHAIPGADGAGLTLLEPDRADTVAESADFARRVDDLQGRCGDGPGITAAAQVATMRSGSLSTDPRWPKFASHVGRLGVHSALALPLRTPIGVVGTMNVYAYERNAFDERAQHLGESFATPAAVTVRHAQSLAQTARLVTNSQSALTSRSMIDQAIGILRSRSGGTAQEAFNRLRTISQTEHTKLAVVAANIVDEAVRRARAWHTHPR